MPGRDHCDNCDFCSMVGNCIGYDASGVSPTAKSIDVVFSDLPPCATDIEEGVTYTLPFYSGGKVDGVCFYAFELPVGFSGYVITLNFTARAANVEGGPCFLAAVSLTAFGVVRTDCFKISVGTCGKDSLAGFYCDGSDGCAGDIPFDINSLCKDEPITLDDGSGPTATIKVTELPDPPTPVDCSELEGCASQMIAEIGGFSDCTSGGVTHTLSNLNDREFFLDYGGPLGGGSHVYEQDLATASDYSDPGIPWANEESGGFYTRTYVYQIQIIVTCVAGKVTITELIVYTQTFTGTDPDALTIASFSNENFTSPSSPIGAPVAGCYVGYMLSAFGYTDCESNPQTMSVAGTIP